MYNVHLNGEIVQTVGNAALTDEQRIGRRRAAGRCKFNRYIWTCEYVLERAKSRSFKSKGGRCPFEDGCIDCPARQTLLKNAEDRKFRIDYKQYRKVSCACIKSIQESKHKMIFITLTFPKFKKNEISEPDANKCFSNFMDNLRTNYDCSHYVAVRERGDNNNRLHYHVLLTLPFVDFRRINLAWCRSISEFCEFSANAVQTDKRTRIISSTVGASKYLAKYFAKIRKSKNIRRGSDSRIVFISHSALADSKKLNNHELSVLLEGFSFEIKKLNDYTYIFSVDDYNKFMEDRIFLLYEYNTRGKPLYHK